MGRLGSPPLVKDVGIEADVARARRVRYQWHSAGFGALTGCR